MKRILAVVLLSFIVVGGLALTAMILVRIHPPLAIFGLALVRGNPACTALQTYRSAKYRVLQNETRQSVRSQVRKVGEEGPYRIWDTPQGRYWTPDSNDEVLPILVAQQLSGIYRITSSGQCARPGDIVLDCGAHIGTYTRRALHDGAAKVVAIEPAPANVECLRRNLSEPIAAGAAVVQPVGVWDRQDTLTLYEDAQNSAAAGFVHPGARHHAGVQVPLVTIDQMVKDLGLPRVDVIKMDIKGATVRALQGARQTIARFHPTIVISTEEEDDDPVQIANLARSIDPRYSLACTSCSMDQWILRPDVVVLQ
jgi:FkbM family methyltransferase